MSFEAYLHRLHLWLWEHGRCFRRGALVINVSDPDVHAFFLAHIRTARPRPFGGRTHAVFAKKHEALTHQVELPLGGNMFCGERKKVALVYLFRHGTQTYAYVKLETAPARSLGHARSAVATYVLHRRSHHQGPSRRETEPYTPQTNDGNYARVRAGAELYIPPGIAKSFL